MTDPVHIAAARLINYFVAEAGLNDIDQILTSRPYLAQLVSGLNAALEQDKPSESSVRHDAPSR